MENQLKELEVLKEVISELYTARECMKDCDSVTTTEYHMFDLYIQELEDRETKLTNELNSYTMEEI